MSQRKKSNTDAADFSADRRLREFYWRIGSLNATRGELASALLSHGHVPTDYLLRYRLRPWQFVLTPRAAWHVLLCRRHMHDLSQAQIQLLHKSLERAEGFAAHYRYTPHLIAALRHLRASGRLSALQLFWLADSGGLLPESAFRQPKTSMLNSGVAIKAMCLLFAACAIALLGGAVTAFASGCFTCVVAGKLILSWWSLYLAAAAFMYSFYKEHAWRCVARECPSGVLGERAVD